MSVKGSEGPLKMGAEYVKEARGMAEFILQRAHRGPGDTVDAAMHRAERLFGVSPAWLHRLRYRHDLTDMPVSAFGSIAIAYQAACAHSERTYENERKLADARGSKLLGLADFVARKKAEG
jgi:hypothetical protein